MNWILASENLMRSGDFTIKRNWLVTHYLYTLRHKGKLIGQYDTADEAKRMAEIVKGDNDEMD